MGIYDRDYYRQGRSGFRLGAPRSAVVAIILINVAVYVLETVDRVSSEGPSGRGSFVADFLAPHVNFDASRGVLPGRTLAWWEHDTLPRPWLWWQFLTCGFVHAPLDPQHIFFNMLMLFFLGRDVESWYGTREFIRLYLAALVFSSVVWAVATRFFDPQPITLIGASGAITSVVALYALNFPKRILLFMMVLPLPAWVVGSLLIGWDIWARCIAATTSPIRPTWAARRSPCSTSNITGISARFFSRPAPG